MFLNVFEWDDNKRHSNLIKHNIDFVGARVEFESFKHGESRLLVVGMANDLLISLVYTLRQEKIRIISARNANQDEREVYYENSKRDVETAEEVKIKRWYRLGKTPSNDG